MVERKIVLIGAGSLAFTPNLLSEMVLNEDLRGSTLGLVDIDAEKLGLMTKLAKRMVQERRADMEVQSSVNRREVLKDADFVIVTIAVGGPDAHDLDVSIPLKYGIYQSVADTVGPGGFSRALRHTPPLVEIARDMEELCPKAILLNETNPMTCLCTAVRHATKINIIGLCHGIVSTKAFLANFLGAKPEEAEVVAAGINHLTWILDFRIQGEDAYPLLKECWAQSRAEIGATGKFRGQPFRYPISFKLFEIYGAFPSPGDRHIAEFYPYFLTEEAEGGRKYGLELYPEGTVYEAGWREKAWQRIVNWTEPGSSLDELFKRRAPGERSLVMNIITALVRKENKVFEAVNIPNEGFVTNLPREAIVEVPAVIGPSGTRGIYVGKLPGGVAATLQHRLLQQELTVEAALTGDRNLALQALLADPMVRSIEVAERLLADLLKAHAPYLLQFH